MRTGEKRVPGTFGKQVPGTCGAWHLLPRETPVPGTGGAWHRLAAGWSP